MTKSVCGGPTPIRSPKPHRLSPGAARSAATGRTRTQEPTTLVDVPDPILRTRVQIPPSPPQKEVPGPQALALLHTTGQNRSPPLATPAPANSLIVLITGPRGVGKTTLCLRTVTLAREARYSCAGLLTLREDDDRRILVDVRTGNRRALTTAGPTAVPVGRYLFDPDALAWGAAILARSTPCDLLVLDELGATGDGGGRMGRWDGRPSGRALLPGPGGCPARTGRRSPGAIPRRSGSGGHPGEPGWPPAWLAGLLPPRRAAG